MKKLQTLALGLVLAVTGSAFAGTVTRDVTVTRPDGSVVTKHVERHNANAVRRHQVNRVIVNPGHHYGQYRHARKVVIVRPAHRHAVHRTVIVRHYG